MPWSDAVAEPGTPVRRRSVTTARIAAAIPFIVLTAWMIAVAVHASVMVNGVLCERAPDTIRALKAAGHDVYAHSWGMDVIPVYLDDDGARANIARNTKALEDVLGERPIGWISPRGTGAPGGAGSGCWRRRPASTSSAASG